MAATSMKFTITLEDKDGQESVQEVNVRIADLARYDILRNRNGFPNQEQGSFLFMVLVSYCSLVRTGKVPVETKIETFIDSVVMIEPVEAEEEAEAPKSE